MIESGEEMSQDGKKCDVCDYINIIPTTTCKNCNARLVKKRSNQRSKQSKGKDKYKRKKNQCSGNKVTYSSRGKAKIIAKKVQKETGRMSRIYKCKDCGGFHLTKYRS